MKWTEITEIAAEIIIGTNKFYDEIKEPWRFITAVSSVSLVTLLLPDPAFLIFVICLVLWRMAAQWLR